MKNKKIMAAIIVSFCAFSHLPLQAARNEEVSAFEHREKNKARVIENGDTVKTWSTEWFAKHRNKVLLVAAGIVALGGAYAWHVYNKKKTTLTSKIDPVLQQKYTTLLKDISTLTAEGTVYDTVYKAGITDLLSSNFAGTADNIDNNTIYKLSFLISYLSDSEKIRDDIFRKIAKLGKAIANLKWPTSSGNLTDQEIKTLTLQRLGVSHPSLKDLIDIELPEMAHVAIKKVTAAFEAANERSQKDQSSTLLVDLYQPGTSITVQEAINDLKSDKLKPFVVLQRAHRLICKLTDINNPELITLQEGYKEALAEFEELTKEGTLYYKMLNEGGIDIFQEEQPKVASSQPDTSDAYTKATKKLSDKILILKKETGLVWEAVKKIQRLAEDIAPLEWPEKPGSAAQLIGKEIEKETFTEVIKIGFSGTPGFNKFTTETLPKLTDAALKKIEKALEGANKRSGESDQNSTMLPSLYEGEKAISVQEALTKLKLLKSSNPFKFLQRAPKFIQALTNINNHTLMKARNDLKTALQTQIKLTAEGSAYKKAVTAKVDGLPDSLVKGTDKQKELMPNEIDVTTDLVRLAKKLESINKTNKQLQEEAITEHTRKKISETGKELAKLRYDDADKTNADTTELTQDISRLTLDDLLKKTIPQMIDAALIKVDAGMEILNEAAGGDQSEKPSSWSRDSPTIKQKREALSQDKTYEALRGALGLMHKIKLEISITKE